MLCIGGWIRELGSHKNELRALYFVPLNVVDRLNDPTKKQTKLEALSTKHTLS